MDKEKSTIETGEKKKGNETPDIIELPEKLKQEIIFTIRKRGC